MKKKFMPPILVIVLLGVFGYALSAQQIDVLPNATVNHSFIANTTYTNTTTGVTEAYIVNNSGGTLNIDAGTYTITFTATANGTGDVNTVFTESTGNTNFHGNEFIINAIGNGTSNAVTGVSLYNNFNEVSFSNTKTTISASTLDGSVDGAKVLESTLIFDCDTYINAQNIAGTSNGIFADNSSVNFDSFSSYLDISSTSTNSTATGLIAQSGSIISFSLSDTSSINIAAVSDNDSAYGIDIDSSDLSVNNENTALTVSVNGNADSSGIAAQGTSTLNFLNYLNNIDVSTIDGEAIGLRAANSEISFVNNDSTSELHILANSSNNFSYGVESSNSTIYFSNALIDITANSENVGAIGIQLDSTDIYFDNASSEVSITASGDLLSHGLYLTNSTIDFSNQLTTINSSAANGTSVGILIEDESTISFNNSASAVEILASGLDDVFGVEAHYSEVDFSNAFTYITAVSEDGIAYSLYNDGSNIFINSDSAGEVLSTDNIAELVGDILAMDSGINNINLTHKDSFITGLLFEENNGINNIYLSSATWYPTGDANSLNQAHLTLDGGVINLAWWNNRLSANNPADAFRTITLDSSPVKVTDNGFTLVVNSDVKNNKADKLVISELSSSSATAFDFYVKLGYDPILETYGTDIDPILVTSLPRTPILEVLSSADGTIINAIGLTSQISSGIYIFDVTPYVECENGANGEIIGYISYQVDHPEVFEPDLLTSLAWLLRSDNLLSRMGELRKESTNVQNGVWARFYHSNMDISTKTGRQFNQLYNGVEVGFDKIKEMDSSKFYYGFFANYLNVADTYVSGAGKIHNVIAGLYATKVYDDGQYYDFILRAGEVTGKYNIEVPNQLTANVDTWMASLSGEYGVRMDLGHNYSIEPQAQFIAGRVGGFSNVTSNGLTGKYENTDSLITRLGFNFAQNFKKDQIYFTSSVFHDFCKNPSVTVSDGIHEATLLADYTNTWFKAALGADVKLSENGTGYLEASRIFARGIGENWRFILGARFVF